MAVSFRQRADLANFSDFSSGILETILNPFYKRDSNGAPDPNRTNLQYLPHKTGDAVSLRKVMDGWLWPTAFVSEPTFPFDEATPYSDNLQGITALPTEHWVVTNTDDISHPRIYEIPMSRNLTDDEPPAYHYAGLSTALRDNEVLIWDPVQQTYVVDPDYNHMGAPSVKGTEVFVPVEYDSTIENRVVTWSGGGQNLQIQRAGRVAENDEPSKSALSLVIVSSTGAMFCGKFRAAGSTYALQVYDESSVVDDDPNNYWTFEGSFLLLGENGENIQNWRTQGGCWTDNGHIYLINDIDVSGSGAQYGLAGISGFDVVSGRRMFHHEIDYANNVPPNPSPANHKEIQDICIFDVDALPYAVPGVVGQVHVLALNNDWPSTDNFVGFHFSVSAADKEKL